MARAKIEIDVYSIDRDTANAAAQGIATIIGDRPEAWTISIKSPNSASSWRVNVVGRSKDQPRIWELDFGPGDQTVEGVVQQFRLDFGPYL
jgi:hypothetical protein